MGMEENPESPVEQLIDCCRGNVGTVAPQDVMVEKGPTGYPTQASVPHSIVNAFKAVLSVTIELDNYTFGLADQYEEYLKDPSKFSGPAGGGGGGGATEAAAVEEEEEEEEAEAPAGGGGLFGDDDGGGDY